jgi:hypothetical protein
MSYTVDEILEDVIQRMGQKAFAANAGEVYVLRRMNKAYQRLNMEHHCCRKEHAADWSIYTASTLVDYVALPSDWIKPYRMNPFRIWRQFGVFRNDEYNTYSIDFVDSAKRVYIANAAVTSLINFSYYSMGLTLVRTVSDATTESNEPEWPEELKQLIYYETLLSVNVPLNEYEVIERNRLMNRMSGMRVQEYLQATSPNIGGEVAHQGRMSDISDPYTRTS